MKQNHALGLTLLELLITLGITGVILALTAGVLASSNRSATLQAAHDLLQQDLSMSQMLLTEHLAAAGSLGGHPGTFQGDNWTSEEQAEILTWLSDHITGSGLRSVAVLTSGGDRITTTRLERIQKSQQAGAYQLQLQQTTFARSATQSLSWTSRDVLCDVTLQTGQVTCALQAGTAQPAIEHLEAFEVFFQSNTGQWSAALPLAKDLRAIGVYMRFKIQLAEGHSCASFPGTAAQLPVASAVLGISTRTYGAPCHARRLEGMQIVHLGNPQWY